MMDDDVKGTKPSLDKDGGAKHDANTVDDEANKESTFEIIELLMCVGFDIHCLYAPMLELKRIQFCILFI